MCLDIQLQLCCSRLSLPKCQREITSKDHCATIFWMTHILVLSHQPLCSSCSVQTTQKQQKDDPDVGLDRKDLCQVGCRRDECPTVTMSIQLTITNQSQLKVYHFGIGVTKV